MSSSVLLSLGSNEGDRAYHLRVALHRLGSVVRLVRISSVWVSDPLGCPPGSPSFFNLVAAGVTSLSAEDLILQTIAIESSLGRVRTRRNAPRPIDIDLIFVGGRRVRSPALVLPHPRYVEREFVLAPIRELGLRWFDSQEGTDIDRMRGKGRVRRLDP